MYVGTSSIPLMSRGFADDLDHDARGQDVDMGTGGHEGCRGATL